MSHTWTPKVCRTLAFLAGFKGLGLLYYMLLRFKLSKLEVSLLMTCTVVPYIDPY